MRRLPRRARLLLIVLLSSGCTFEYGDPSGDSELERSPPQIEIYGVEMVISRANRIEISADHVATYAEEEIQEIRGLTFREYDPGGELRVEGSADRATLHLDTEDIQLEGTIRFRSSIEDALVESEFLYWNNDSRVLTAEGNEVTLYRDDGSRITGRGLILDGRRNSVRFTGGVRGSYVAGEESGR